jgi:hypothetical protein
MFNIININGKTCIPLQSAIMIVSMYILQEKGIQVIPQINNQKDIELFEKAFNIACVKLNIDFYE